MKYFTLLYLIYLDILLLLLFFHHNIASNALDYFQRDLLVEMLRWLFEQRVIDYYVVISPNYSITIDRSCNGVVPLLIFWAAILAYDTRITDKLQWMFIGYTTLIFTNFLRIVFVIYMVLLDRKYFTLAHDYIGNGFLMLVGFGLFTLFMDRIDSQPKYKP
ncbi:MAG: exosortase/archaeosortase family protein [Campylobacterota bacterium]|nr:exosortase/archaeosortase family protein [Campylobacterota bacterium]